MYDNVLDGMRGGGQLASWAGAPEFFPDSTSFGRPQGRPWGSRQMYQQGGGILMPGREKNGGRHGPSISFGDHEHGHVPNEIDRKGHGDAAHDLRIVAERVEDLRHSQSEADTKRAKQQYAQRSRVRKIQYIQSSREEFSPYRQRG
ncbi:hypothetical protein Zm00014a_002445 [Zea mays]|uniref:Uncharacterized protein n=1 Tax=Zea mays TaxID=4577 RepID=A0A3L6EEF9_MAIZE|nr:hypothetical protein Zm00014a_002445 [Zea mays]